MRPIATWEVFVFSDGLRRDELSVNLRWLFLTRSSYVLFVVKVLEQKGMGYEGGKVLGI